jgi:dTMP kinase
MKKGVFIVVDGLDGSGKSEIVKMLHNYLFSKNKKYRIMTTREPTNGKYGSRIRKMLAKEKNPFSSSKRLVELFVSDRKDHLKKNVEPFLRTVNGHELNIVICDRYYYSTVAFQGAQGMDIKMLVKKNSKFRKPDLALILDVKPEIALKRISNRKNKEKFEQLEFMRKIRKNFLNIGKMFKDNIKIINASRSKAVVFADIKKEVSRIV